MSHSKNTRQLTCGCCYSGCVCQEHADPTVGVPAETCKFHALRAFLGIPVKALVTVEQSNKS
jgi:hypothetical protein